MVHRYIRKDSLNEGKILSVCLFIPVLLARVTRDAWRQAVVIFFPLTRQKLLRVIPYLIKKERSWCNRPKKGRDFREFTKTLLMVQINFFYGFASS